MGVKIIVDYVYEIHDSTRYSVVVFGRLQRGTISKHFVVSVTSVGDVVDVSVGILRYVDAKGLGLIVSGAWQASRSFEWYVHYIKYASNREHADVCVTLMLYTACFDIDPRDEYAGRHINRLLSFASEVMKAASKIVSSHTS